MIMPISKAALKSATCIGLTLLTSSSTLLASSPILKEGERIAILGDSITEAKKYSVDIESYLLLCSGIPNIQVFQFGWAGGHATGMARRMVSDVLPWKPTFITTCYGMNDAGTRKFDPTTIGAPYKAAMTEIVTTAEKNQMRVLIGSPGVVDTYYAANGPSKMDVAIKNESLLRLAEIARELSRQEGRYFSDIHTPMLSVMERSKADHGEKYALAGVDGIHPSFAGHLVMAYAFLKAMQLDGQIAVIEMDYAGKTTASEGHTIVSQTPGKVEIVSSRYPFCFPKGGDPTSAENKKTVLPYIGFQNDLNRFTLKVTNLPAERAKITWGNQSREFSAAELKNGINLADAFIEENPFSKRFALITSKIVQKQSYETTAIKSYMNALSDLKVRFKDEADPLAAIALLQRRIFEKQDELSLAIKKEAVPVRHTITVTPLPNS